MSPAPAAPPACWPPRRRLDLPGESGGSGSAAFTPAEEAPAAPWSSCCRCPGPRAGRALFLLQTFGFCGPQETGATLSKSSRCRLGGSGGGGMSEQLKGRARGRRLRAPASAAGRGWQGIPAGPAAGRRPAAEHLPGISQSCNNKKEGREGVG